MVERGSIRPDPLEEIGVGRYRIRCQGFRPASNACSSVATTTANVVRSCC